MSYTTDQHHAVQSLRSHQSLS